MLSFFEVQKEKKLFIRFPYFKKHFYWICECDTGGLGQAREFSSRAICFSNISDKVLYIFITIIIISMNNTPLNNIRFISIALKTRKIHARKMHELDTCCGHHLLGNSHWPRFVSHTAWLCAYVVGKADVDLCPICACFSCILSCDTHHKIHICIYPLKPHN